MKEKAHIEIDENSVHITGEQGERINIEPDNVHVIDSETEVNISKNGIQIDDGNSKVSINL